MYRELLEILAPLRKKMNNKNRHLLKDVCQRYHLFFAESSVFLGRSAQNPILEHVELVVRMKLDIPSVFTVFLIPLLEEGQLELEEIKELFGEEVSKLCALFLHLPDFTFPEGDLSLQADRQEKEWMKKQAESFRKMLLAMSSDLRVVLLRLCDRLFRLRRLEFTPLASQRMIARECREIYAPLANRMGVSWMKNELEDVSLRFLDPHPYYKLVSNIAEKQDERFAYIKQVQASLVELMEQHDIPFEVMGRSKHLNSIYGKMKKRNLSFDRLFDILAFRILCDTKEQCYQVLGLIHDHWKPIPGRFKDYIAIPKPNMYQSLHTTVLGPDNKRIEVQIRTHEMHHLAEDGVAAHWMYKENKTSQDKVVEKFQWLRNLLRLQDEESEDHEFIASVHDHLSEGEVFIFTPKGEVREFARGATPIDFAYAIHTKVGDTCVGAKVNGKMVPLRSTLHNGDLVEILTSSSAEPSHDWLSFVKTGRARTKIRSFLGIELRKEALRSGRDLLEKELPSTNRSITKLSKKGILPQFAKEQGYASLDEMLMTIGHGRLSAKDIVEQLFPSEVEEVLEEVVIKKPTTRSSKGGVLVGGMSGILTRFAECCNPIPGDPIIGVISRSRGISVHRTYCPRIKGCESHRLMDVSWDDGADVKHVVTLRVISEDRAGILSLVSKVFADQGINIIGALCKTIDERAINQFSCQVSDLKELNKLQVRLENLRGVEEVTRLRK